MKVVSLHDRDQIAAVLRRNSQLHLYALGDLDDFFWPQTQWYGWQDAGDIREIILLYTAFETPVMLAITENSAAMSEFIRAALPLLPRKIYAHLSEGLLPVVAGDYHIEGHGKHDKMALTNPAALNNIDTSAVVAVSPTDTDELQNLFAIGNPIAWFDMRLLETGLFYGIRQDGRLVSVAGIHVYSPLYRAAALGNVVTHPDFRGRGFAKATCAKLCTALRRNIDHIGLNVVQGNAAALRCYQQLGFERVGVYGEYMLELK